MRIPVDLHIHSALSPCADASMTPGDIVGMAALKGLVAIAVTDHQSCGNLAVVERFAREAGIVAVPGMELETSEEIHLVCLFPDLPAALVFEGEVRASMPDRPNRADIFGPQVLFDLDNEPCAEEPRLLLHASGIGIDEAFRRVAELGGVAIPAHVDREANSLLATLGAVPPDLPLRWVEISARCDEAALLEHHPALAAFGRLRSSDAHRLGEILEPCMLLDVSASPSGKTDIFMVLESLRPEKRR